MRIGLNRTGLKLYGTRRIGINQFRTNIPWSLCEHGEGDTYPICLSIELLVEIHRYLYSTCSIELRRTITICIIIIMFVTWSACTEDDQANPKRCHLDRL